MPGTQLRGLSPDRERLTHFEHIEHLEPLMLYFGEAASAAEEARRSGRGAQEEARNLVRKQSTTVYSMAHHRAFRDFGLLFACSCARWRAGWQPLPAWCASSWTSSKGEHSYTT